MNAQRQYGMLITGFIFLLLLLESLGAAATPLRYIPPMPGGITIDGKLDERWYRTTPPVENFKIAGQPEREAPRTQAWIFWSEWKMIFAFNCVDPSIGAKPPSWDEMAVAPQDRVEFYLWSGDEEDTFICFEIAALGAALHYRTNYYRFFNFGWTPETLHYEVSLTPEGYSMEAEIYAEDLAQANIHLKPGARFRAGLYRSDVDSIDQENEPTWITWVEDSKPFPDFHVPRSVGEFVLEDEEHPGPALGLYRFWEVGEQRVKLRPGGVRKPVILAPGESVDGWKLIWTGAHDDNVWALMEGESEYAFISDESRMIRLSKPPAEREEIDPMRLYDGKSMEEVLASRTDILGEQVLKDGSVDFDTIAALLPPIANGYQILGAPLTGGVSPVLTREGVIRRGDTVLFDPGQVESRLQGRRWQAGLMDGWIPIAHYFDLDAQFVLTAFVPIWERGASPSVWIRLAEINNGEENERFWRTDTSTPRTLDKDEFWQGFMESVFHWKEYEKSLSLPDIPDQNVLRCVKGSLALSHIVFMGEHPHYGASGYGATVHDTFPPAFIAVLESAFRYGESDWAKRLTAYWFDYCVNQDGTIRYWQRDVRPAASASEYGMIYQLLEEIGRAWGNEWIHESALDKMEASAHYLHSLREPIEPGGPRLIHLGAEADNAEYKRAYFSNNLWAVRGFESLSKIFERRNRRGTAAHLRHMAQDLTKDIEQALAASAIETDYGLLPPIHPGYAALPLTLSLGMQKPEGIEDEIWRMYTKNDSVSLPGENQAKQNLRENTYANYRYYLEMLSSGGLPGRMVDAIDRMRADRGGSILGMTRFMSWLDDWPVAEWAKYLLHTNRLDEYWLLLYAHMAHHQDHDTLTAFEQVPDQWDLLRAGLSSFAARGAAYAGLGVRV